MPFRRLTRSRTEGKIAGVCAGIANYFDVDVVLVRAAWVVFSIVPGAVIGGVLAYIAAWLVIPEATDTDAAAARTPPDPIGHRHEARWRLRRTRRVLRRRRDAHPPALGDLVDPLRRGHRRRDRLPDRLGDHSEATGSRADRRSNRRRRLPDAGAGLSAAGARRLRQRGVTRSALRLIIRARPASGATAAAASRRSSGVVTPPSPRGR